MQENKQLIVLTHLSQLVTLIIGFGSLLLPLIIWLTQRDKVLELDQHGKIIVNFQLSILGLISIIFPVINAIKASHGETPKYPLSFNFIS